MLFLILPLLAAEPLLLRAEVAADLRHVRGRMEGGGGTWVDPLGKLPVPEGDRDRIRTFPGRVSVGKVSWSEGQFETELPIRYGDLGWLPRRGLRANGGWYPQPLEDGKLPVFEWDVEVTLPEGTVGVLNGVVGEGTLRWSGEADRLALAVVPGARVVEVPMGEGRVRFVEQGAPENHLHRWMGKLLTGAWALSEPPDLVVVEDLDLERLASAGPGVLYLSDRTARLFPGMSFVHAVAVAREAHIASVPVPDGWWRSWVGSALADALPESSVKKLLGWFSWNPVIDALLNDGTLPFYGDIFNEADVPPEGVGQIEVPRIAPRAAAAQVDVLLGKGHSQELASRLLASACEKSPDCLARSPATMLAGEIPAELLDGWTRPYDRQQNYRVKVEKGQVTLVREADPEAPAEVVGLRGADGVPWQVGPGPGSVSRPLGKGGVRLDPSVLTVQTNRVDDHWPARWQPVLSGGFSNISPTQKNVDVFVDGLLRREGDTHSLYYLALGHDQQDLLQVVPGYLYYFGPLLDRRTRAHRFHIFSSLSLLDPGFRPTEYGSLALGASLRYAWDNRTEEHGHRYGVGVGGGLIPGSTERWVSGSVTAIQYLPLAPRHMLAFRGLAGAASGEVDHRLLPLGGGDMLRSLPEDAIVGNEVLVMNLEYRWAALRNISVPLGVAWLSEVLVHPGLELGTLWRGTEQASALGVSLGVFPVVDFLGARPTLLGVTCAWPVWTKNLQADGMQVYLEFELPY